MPTDDPPPRTINVARAAYRAVKSGRTDPSRWPLMALMGLFVALSERGEKCRWGRSIDQNRRLFDMLTSLTEREGMPTSVAAISVVFGSDELIPQAFDLLSDETRFDDYVRPRLRRDVFRAPTPRGEQSEWGSVRPSSSSRLSPSSFL